MAHIPPSIRVFISSTFADMEAERHYFNTVIAPKLKHLCTDRGVSFFTVDLRWGITKEDQIDGKVLPICLSEIDHCRPYFIGIIGDRYGSTVKQFSESDLELFPWLAGHENSSVTELEMLHGVLNNEGQSKECNSVFLFRDADNQTNTAEPKENKEKLSSLKKRIKSDSSIPSYDYSELKEFGEHIISTFTGWLNRYFPSTDAVKKVREKWYNEELLRNYIDFEAMSSFLDKYCTNSTRPLLLHGTGARGKTTFLTNWQPKNGEKILINCGSDIRYHYWPEIAHEIVKEINRIDSRAGYPKSKLGASLLFRLKGAMNKNGGFSDDTVYYVTDEELDSFRREFISWISRLKLNTHVCIVINDLELITDVNSRYLNWLPAELPDKLDLICSSNDESILENSRIFGWNEREMSVFSPDEIHKLLGAYAGMYGKKLSPRQQEDLVNSPLMIYPGHIKFYIQFMNIYGRFDNLSELTSLIRDASAPQEMYRQAMNVVLRTSSEEEITRIYTVFAILSSSFMELQESECYEIAEKLVHTDMLKWADIRTVLEVFGAVNGEYWRIYDPSIKAFARSLPVDFNKVHEVLGEYYEQLLTDDIQYGNYEQIKENTEYAKAVLYHYTKAEAWDKLCECLKKRQLLYFLSKVDWKYVRVAWMNILLHTDINIADILLELYRELRREKHKIDGISESIARLLYDLEQYEAADIIFKECFIQPSSALRQTDISRISEPVIKLYNSLCDLHGSRDYRQLKREADLFLAQNGEKLNSHEKCCIYRLKLGADLKLGAIDDGLRASGEYYKHCLQVMNNYETITAISEYGQCLYASGDVEQAYKQFVRAERLALSEGALREYLSVKNTEAMCCYRMGQYEMSISIYDSLLKIWERLKNKLEMVSVWINRCNAISISGKTEEALEELYKAYDFCKKYEAEVGISSIVNVVGNIGSFNVMLGKHEDAEKAYLEVIAKVKGSNHEQLIENTYYGLIDLYVKTSQFTKAIDIYDILLECLYKNHQYPELAKSFTEYVNLLHYSKYEEKAEEVSRKWEAVFDTVPNGKAILMRAQKSASDKIETGNLKEQLIVAISAGDTKKCAELSEELAVNESDCSEAVRLFVQAAEYFDACRNEVSSERCVCLAAAKAFELNADKRDEVLASLKSKLSAPQLRILDMWKMAQSICARAESENEINSRCKENSEYSELILKIAEGLSDNCLMSEMCMRAQKKYIPYLLTKADLMSLADILSGSTHFQYLLKDIQGVCCKYAFEDISFLRQTYASEISAVILNYYEKALEFMRKTKHIDAAAIAGNIAIIFRRRRDKQKSIYYHTLAAELYGAAGEYRDCYIETMNLATAYKEFDEKDKCISLLRETLKKENLALYPDLHAAIAGNLAGFLTNDLSSDIKEITDCYAIEERIYRELGEDRELAISLINQMIFYLKDKQKNYALIKEKYEQAEKIISQRGLKEFSNHLKNIKSAIEPTPKPDEKESMLSGSRADEIRSLLANLGKGGVTPRQFLKQMLEKDNLLNIGQIEKDEPQYISVICVPKQDIPLAMENVLITLDFRAGKRLDCTFAIKLQKLTPEADMILRQYVQWWNTQGEYEIFTREKDNLYLAYLKKEFTDDAKMTDEFCRMSSLWIADCINSALVLVGASKFDDMREMKLKVLKKTE